MTQQTQTQTVRTLNKLICTSLLSFIAVQSYAQLKSSKPIAINSEIIDTVKTQLNSTLMRMIWWNDTINVKVQHKDLKMDTALISFLRKDAKDPSLYTKQEDINEFLNAMKIGAQNCYSYALQRYFDESKTYSQNTFNELSDIDRKSAEKILSKHFKKVKEISTHSKQSLNSEIPNKAVLAFINASDWAVHFVYHADGVFYSKNGAFAPIEFQSLKKFLKKHYWDTEKIEVYQIDKKKAD